MAHSIKKFNNETEYIEYINKDSDAEITCNFNIGPLSVEELNRESIYDTTLDGVNYYGYSEGYLTKEIFETEGTYQNVSIYMRDLLFLIGKAYPISTNATVVCYKDSSDNYAINISIENVIETLPNCKHVPLNDHDNLYHYVCLRYPFEFESETLYNTTGTFTNQTIIMEEDSYDATVEVNNDNVGTYIEPHVSHSVAEDIVHYNRGIKITNYYHWDERPDSVKIYNRQKQLLLDVPKNATLFLEEIPNDNTLYISTNHILVNGVLVRGSYGYDFVIDGITYKEYDVSIAKDITITALIG